MATTHSQPAGAMHTRPLGSSAQSAIQSIDRQVEPPQYEISFGPFRLLPARRLLLKGHSPVPLGGRVVDLLIALAERPGEIVSKSELIATVWPHACVDAGNLKVRVAALRRALGDGRAGERYISTVVGRGYCFVAPISRSIRPGPVTAELPAAKSLTNLPAPVVRLIGRDEVVGRVSAQLARQRLITLIGPGGVGKTSVAVATAGALADNYEHGVWFVDLAAIDDPRLLPAAVSSAIRLDIAAEKPCPDLIPFLSDKQILLVLDNCEHIIEAAAVLAFRVLRAAPSVQILATSREPFGLEGEFLHHLKPLGFPSVSHGLSAAEALDFPAIQLFIERAANALGGFSLRDLDVPVVVDICRKLDGIPLAIVLAAGTVDALGLWGVLSRMDDPLRLPVTRHCTAIPHHRTLRANLDWSYHLLAQEEQQTLRRLSVFTGSFTMAAAAMIATDPTCIEYEIVDRVVALVAKSLIEADADGSATRLRLLATTRAYARERLAESGEEVGILRRGAGLR